VRPEGLGSSPVRVPMRSMHFFNLPWLWALTEMGARRSFLDRVRPELRSENFTAILEPIV
jgi:hypothetical protein